MDGEVEKKENFSNYQMCAVFLITRSDSNLAGSITRRIAEAMLAREPNPSDACISSRLRPAAWRVDDDDELENHFEN